MKTPAEIDADIEKLKPVTQPNTPERAAALREWQQHEGTKLLLAALQRERAEHKTWIEDAMAPPAYGGADVITSEADRARVLILRGNVQIYDTLVRLLVIQIEQGAAPPVPAPPPAP